MWQECWRIHTEFGWGILLENAYFEGREADGRARLTWIIDLREVEWLVMVGGECNPLRTAPDGRH
jgi:hypothetical protein